jgi:hypothetical protein
VEVGGKADEDDFRGDAGFMPMGIAKSDKNFPNSHSRTFRDFT